MAINLTTPIAVPDVAYQGITNIDFHLPHYMDVGNSNAMKLNKPDVVVMFVVTTWDGDGRVISEETHHSVFSGWPPAFITDVSSVYGKLEQYSISQGFMNDGTGEAI